ncbi:MAG TPA: DUF4197 domain-containing protein [Stellaceae bacterium]|nr:DUF4197 domain-containing protein [Stellaceae bacterium]
MIRTPSRRSVLGFLAAGAPFAALAQGSLLQQGEGLLGKVPSGGGQSGGNAGAGLSSGEIGSGLKDALKVASQRVVDRVGKVDGYNGDPAIRIPLPGPLEKIEGPLKAMGAGGALSDLQLKMNRAAEQAAPKALDIFIDAASKMTINDAHAILAGPNDAATQYFRRTSSASLTQAFRPVVQGTLSSVGAVQAFSSVQAKAQTIPFGGQEVAKFNLTDFTVGKALDGLFHYMAVEEAAIRTNPAARSTELLKKVFG